MRYRASLEFRERYSLSSVVCLMSLHLRRLIRHQCHELDVPCLVFAAEHKTVLQLQILIKKELMELENKLVHQVALEHLRLFPPNTPWITSEQYMDLWRKSSDMSIATSDRIYHCHRILVLGKSPMLAARVLQFSHPGPISFPEFEDVAMQLVLSYMYSPCVIELDDEAVYPLITETEVVLCPRIGSTLSLSVKNAMLLYSAALFFGMEDLVFMLYHILSTSTLLLKNAQLVCDFAHDYMDTSFSEKLLDHVYAQVLAFPLQDPSRVPAALVQTEEQCLSLRVTQKWTDPAYIESLSFLFISPD